MVIETSVPFVARESTALRDNAEYTVVIDPLLHGVQASRCTSEQLTIASFPLAPAYCSHHMPQKPLKGGKGIKAKLQAANRHGKKVIQKKGDTEQSLSTLPQSCIRLLRQILCRQPDQATKAQSGQGPA